jgi:small subunit ribosomal protein S17
MSAEMQNVASEPQAATGRPRPKRVGVVTSAKRDKTIRVTVSYMVRHAKYGKLVRRRTVMHAHDERNECGDGDRVEIVQCRPLSKTKHWRLVRIVERAPQQQTKGAGA